MACMTEFFTVEYEDKKIPAAFTRPSGGPNEVCIILAHGAGGDMNSKQLVLLSETIADMGISVLRFTCKGLNFKYRTKVYTKVVSFILTSTYGIKECFLAGRSMGSRVAVDVANEYSSDGTASIRGVICLSYPLYPPKYPDKMRDVPLYDLKHSSLFISGDSDVMCSRDKMESVLKRTHGADMQWIQNAGHDLINKSVGLEETVNVVANKIVQWCSKQSPIIAVPAPVCEVLVKRRKKSGTKAEVKGGSGNASINTSHCGEPKSIVRAKGGVKASTSYRPILTDRRKRRHIVSPDDTLDTKKC